MSDEEARQWVVEPPGAGEISLRMAFGDGVQLTAEQETALLELVRSLEAADSEVTGFSRGARAAECPSLCNTLECPRLGGGPCTAYVAPSGGWNIMGTFTLPT